MPFSTAGMNCRGIEPPKMSSTNSKSAPRGERLDLDLAVAELAVAAGLLLVAAVRFGRGLDRLAIRDARRLQVDVDAEAALQLGDGDLDVQLALARRAAVPWSADRGCSGSTGPLPRGGASTC